MQTDKNIIDPTKTRKDALVFETDQPAAMIGYYLAEPLARTWTEDFMDSDSGEVLTIDREEIILRRGDLITPEQAQSISFYLQSGEINEPNFTFIVKTLDVDTAKAAATAWISAKIRRNHNETNDGKEISSIKTTLTAAKPFSCAALINRTFCEAYRITK